MSRGINVTVISSSAVFSSTTENADEFTTMNPDTMVWISATENS
jgi:hypothetical protein